MMTIRRKKASLLLALLLSSAAVILTIVYLTGRVPGPGNSDIAGPGQESPRVPPGSPIPSPAAPGGATGVPGGAAAANDSSGVRCLGGRDGLICPKNFAIAGNAIGLYPGNTVQLPLTIQNPNQAAIRVTRISVSVTETSSASCGTSNLDTSDYAGPGFIVPGGGSSTISLPITMPREAPDACQDVTFKLSYGGEAEPA